MSIVIKRFSFSLSHITFFNVIDFKRNIIKTF